MIIKENNLIYFILFLSSEIFQKWYNINDLKINGILYLDFADHPTNIKFITGGIGKPFVTIYIQSEPGHAINSKFWFFTTPTNASVTKS